MKKEKRDNLGNKQIVEDWFYCEELFCFVIIYENTWKGDNN